LTKRKLPGFQAQMSELRLPSMEGGSTRLGSQPTTRTVDNSQEWNVHVDANYSERQSPARISDDLTVIAALAQS